MGSAGQDPVWEVPAWSRLDVALLGAAWASALLVLGPDLGHAGMVAWDEVLHQLATRSTLVSPLRPFLFDGHLVPVSLSTWWLADTWLHKPPLPYWLGGLVMRLVGVTPLALRLVSLAAVLGTQALVFALARRLVSPVLAALAAALYGLLPFAWQLVQGVFFGDVHDVALALWNTLGVWALVRGVETRRRRWALLAGAAVGLGYLTKSLLALTPLGVAVALAGLGVLAGRPRRFLPVSHALLALGAAVLVAGPWELHTFQQFPDVYRAEYRHHLRHLDPTLTAEVGSWDRPVDAVFFELLGTELAPLPQPTALLAGLTLAVFAVTRRHPVHVATALWVWATWLVNSAAVIKVPAQVWGAVPGLLVALAVLVGAGLQRPALGLATLASLLATPLAARLPGAGRLARLVPWRPLQLHDLPGVADGYALAAVATVALLALVRQREPWRARLAGGVLLAWLPMLGLGGWLAAQAHRDQRLALAPAMFSAPFQALGRELDRVAPPRAVLWLDPGPEAAGQSSVHSLLFWAGRLTYQGRCDVALSEAHGRPPLLVSARPEALAVVASVPGSPLLAYDCRTAAAPPPPPDGLRRFTTGPGAPAGWGVSEGGGHLATWTAFLPRGAPAGRLHFVDEAGLEVAPPAELIGLASPGEGAWRAGWALGPPPRPGLTASWLP